jgi:hypothetical protein
MNGNPARHSTFALAMYSGVQPRVVTAFGFAPLLLGVAIWLLVFEY